MGTTARDTGYHLVHYLRKVLNIGGSGGLTSGATVSIGTIPANAALVPGGGVWINTDLGGTTNLLDVGYAADSLSSLDINAYATALALPITTGGFVPLDEIVAATGVTAKPRSVPTNVTCTFTGTGTTGQIDVIVAYVPLR